MNRESGFTLLEILIVVMLVGILMTVLATTLIPRGQQAQVDLAGAQLRSLEQALELYRLDNGRYPSAEQGLDALVREPTTEPLPRRYSSGGYATARNLLDPWGSRLQYRVPGTHNPHSFDLWSFGPDGVEGGDGAGADIVNWDTGTVE